MLHLLEERETIWNRLRRQNRPIVLYGMGNGADKILEACTRYGIPVSGVFASDGFVRGHRYRDFPVRSLAELEEELGDFTVLLSFATQRPEVLAQIDAVAARHTLLAPDLPVSGSDLFTMEYLLEHEAAAERTWSLLADDASRQVYLDVLNFKISGKIHYLRRSESPREAVWPELLRPGPGEVFVDAGAYNGDTVEEFLTHVSGRWREIYALEPDRRNYKKLVQAAERYDSSRIHCFQAGAWSKDDTLLFAHKSGRQAALSEEGVPTPVRAVDSLLEGRPATLIKYDVEGAEHHALLGTRETIARWRPKLAVSAYHRSDDLFSLPALVGELHPGYRIYLRRHPYIPAWDTCLYAIPEPSEVQQD